MERTMQLDLKTAAIITAITHLIQMIIFAQQYYSNRDSKEIKWWLYWSVCIYFSLTVAFFRYSGNDSLRHTIIIIQNIFMGTGAMFLYVGVMKFFKLRAYKVYLYGAFLFLLAIFIFFTFVRDDIYIRSIVINSYLSFFGLLPAYVIFKNRHTTSYSASNLVMVTFFVHGSFFLVRTLIIASGGLNLDNMFEGNLINHLTFIDALVMGVIWTFGFIVLHNEKLNLKLNETKNKFQSFFNTSPDIAIITSAKDGKIIEANETFFKASVYSREEALGSTSIAMKLWKNPEDRNRVVAELKKGKPISNFEAVFVKKNGNEFHGLISSVLIKIENELNIMSIVRDVTESRKQERELLDSAEKWERTFNAISDPVFLLGADGQILNHNKAATIAFKNKDLCGLHVCDVVHSGKGHTEACPSAMIRHISKSESAVVEHEGKWFEITSDPIVSGGELTGAVHVVSDITEKKLTDEKIHRNVKELQDMNRIMVDRELKMTELKKEINELLKAAGKEAKY
jgi:PAS domain S-box-containing protein